MANITTTEFTSTTSHTKNTKRWKKINKLWIEVDRKRQRNQNFQAKIETFYQEFKDQVGGLEEEVCEATEQFATHLMGFIPRKTIKGSQREELYDWIEQELQLIEANPFNSNSTEQARLRFNQAIDDYHQTDSIGMSIPQNDAELNFIRELIYQDFGLELALDNETLWEMVNEPVRFKKYMESLLEQQFTDEGLEHETHHNNSTNQETPFIKELTNKSNLFEDKLIKKLFRQLAKCFHPDLVTDSSRATENLALMKELSNAKKNKDPITILLLAQAHLPEHKLDMDTRLLSQLELALQDKLTELNVAYHQLQHGSDIQAIVWHRFGGGSSASRKITIERYRNELKLDIKQLQHQTKQLRTVKQLTIELRKRLRAPINILNHMPKEILDNIFNDYPHE